MNRADIVGHMLALEVFHWKTVDRCGFAGEETNGVYSVWLYFEHAPGERSKEQNEHKKTEFLSSAQSTSHQNHLISSPKPIHNLQNRKSLKNIFLNPKLNNGVGSVAARYFVFYPTWF